MSIFWIMGSQNKIQKFYTLFTKNVCRAVFRVLSLIDTEFSINLVLCKRIFQEYITFSQVLPTV